MSPTFETLAKFAMETGRVSPAAIARARHDFLSREGLTSDAAAVLTSRERAALASRWHASPERESAYTA